MYLFINSKNHKDDYIIEESAMPDYLIKSATGTTLLLQTLPMLRPITNFNDIRIVNSSTKFFDMHKAFFNVEKPIMQVR